MQLALGAFRDQIMEELMVLMSDIATMASYIKKRRHCFSSDVRSQTKDTHLARTIRYPSRSILENMNGLTNQFICPDQLLPTR